MAKDLDFSAFDEGVKNHEDFSKPQELPDQPGMAALAGIGQGGSFGFGDELAGAAGGAYDTLTNPAAPGQSKLDQLMEQYKGYRDLARRTNKELETSNPKSYLAGEIGGAVVSPANALLPGTSLGKGASGLSKLLNSLKAGTTAGAAAGLGSSEAPTAGGDIENTIQGAKTGAIAGGILPVAAGIGGFAAETAGGTKLAKAIKQAYKYGKAGEDVVSSNATRPLEEAITNESGNVLGELRGEAGKLAKGQNNIINSDTRQYDLGDFGDQIDQKIADLKNGPPGSESDIAKLEAMKDYIKKPKFNDNDLDAQQAYNDYVANNPDKKNPTMTSDQLDSLKKQFQGLADVNPDYTNRMTTDVGEQAAKELTGSLTDAINNSNPELSGQNKLISNFNNQLESAGIKNLRADKMDPSDLRRTQEYLTGLISKNEKTGLTSQNARDRIDALKAAVQETNPELATKIGDTFSELSNKADLNKYANSDSNLFGLSVLPAKQGTVRAAQETGKFIKDVTTSLGAKTPEFFKTLGTKLAQSSDEASQHLGPILNNLAGKDANGRKAMIFVLMQNPMFRGILGQNVEVGDGQ